MHCLCGEHSRTGVSMPVSGSIGVRRPDSHRLLTPASNSSLSLLVGGALLSHSRCQAWIVASRTSGSVSENKSPTGAMNQDARPLLVQLPPSKGGIQTIGGPESNKNARAPGSAAAFHSATPLGGRARSASPATTQTERMLDVLVRSGSASSAQAISRVEPMITIVTGPRSRIFWART